VRSVIKEKREVAKGTLLVVFDLQGAEVDFRAGQYFWVELPNRGRDDDKGLRRHISVVTSPTDRGVLGLCTRLRDTAFKQTLAELESGTRSRSRTPRATTGCPRTRAEHYVFVAGGIGITVFRSMLRYIADTGEPYRVTLVYSNRDRESTPFLDELPELESRIPGLQVVLTMTEDDGWDGRARRVDAEMLRDHLGELGAPHVPRRGPAADGRVRRRAAVGRRRSRGAGAPDRFSGY
jgi:ferredoxin-NADP reductase